MNHQQLTILLEQLLKEPYETEWLEFKMNHCEPQPLKEDSKQRRKP